jgi:large subunit ribosomal protein L17
MRHRKRTAKLGMKSQHRRATLANLVCSLITHNRVRTTVAKAKVARRLADRMVTLAKKGSLHDRRQALGVLRQKPAVKKLFAEIGKQHGDRNGGYTRIIRIGQRSGDAAEMVILEWTGSVTPLPEPESAGKTSEPKPEDATKAPKNATESK